MLTPKEEQVVNAVFSMFLIIWLSTSTMTLLRRYSKFCPIKGLITLYTTLIVTLTQTVPQFSKYKADINMYCLPNMFYLVFIPCFLIKSFYNCDKYVFARLMPYSLLVSCVLVVIRSLIQGFFVGAMMRSAWIWKDRLTFGLMFVTMQPQFVMSLMKEERHRSLKILLQCEVVTAVPLVWALVDVIQAIYDNTLVYWYQITCVVIRLCVIGTLWGYICGIFTALITKLTANDPYNYMCIIGICTLLTAVTSWILALSISCALIMMCIIVFQYKEGMTDESNNILKTIIDFIFNVVDLASYTFCLYRVTVLTFYVGNISLVRMVLTYIGLISSRLITLLPLYQLLRWYSPGISFQRILLLAMAYATSNVSLILILQLFYLKETNELARELVPLMVFVNLVTHVIHSAGFIYYLKTVLVKKLSQGELVNMHNCLAYINEQKNKYILMWKMKSMMGDVRWDKVRQLTNIKQSFLKDYKEINAKNMSRFTPKTGVCPECHRVVTAELTIKDKTDMKKDATRIVLSEMKSIIIRKQAVGIASRDCANVIRKMLDVMFENNNLTINKAEIEAYFRKNKLLNSFGKCYYAMFKFNVKNVKKPRRQCRRKCYFFIISKKYRMIVIICTLVAVYPMVVFPIAKPLSLVFISAIFVNLLITVLMTIEFIVTIQAYSFIYTRDGLKTYFSSFWHGLDFMILLSCLVDVPMTIAFHSMKFNERQDWWFPLDMLRLLRVVKLFQFTLEHTPKLLRVFDEITMARYSFGYEALKMLKVCLDETLLILHRVIPNNFELETECREKIEKERTYLLNMMIKAKIDYSSVVTFVNTKQALGATIKSMFMTLDDLKVAGFIDEIEYHRLHINIKKVELKSTIGFKKYIITEEEIFASVPWMPSNNKIFEYLASAKTMNVIKEGSVVCSENTSADGIYIVVSGMLKMNYVPKLTSIDNLYNNGIIPIVDYTESVKFDREFDDLMAPGNTFGELSFLTDRTYDCTITAITPVKCYFLNRHCLTQAIEMNMDPIEGLAPMLWKCAVGSIATAVLLTTPAFETYTKYEIRQKLERSFVPNLQGYRTFSVTPNIEDILLLDGRVISFYDKRSFNAPCYIPRTVTKMVFSINEETKHVAVLLILPMPEIDIYGLINDLDELADVSNKNDDDYKFRLSKMASKKIRGLRRRTTITSSEFHSADWFRTINSQ